MGEKVQRPSPAAVAPLPADRAFVVQLRAPSHSSGDLFTGRVEHIASGSAMRFDSAEDLIAFITKVLRTEGSES
jgi:hypothetical protein